MDQCPALIHCTNIRTSVLKPVVLCYIFTVSAAEQDSGCWLLEKQNIQQQHHLPVTSSPRSLASSTARRLSYTPAKTTATAWDRFIEDCMRPVGMAQACVHSRSSDSVNPFSSLPNTRAVLPAEVNQTAGRRESWQVENCLCPVRCSCLLLEGPAHRLEPASWIAIFQYACWSITLVF